jgi:hypothetical protein
VCPVLRNPDRSGQHNASEEGEVIRINLNKLKPSDYIKALQSCGRIFIELVDCLERAIRVVKLARI